MQSLIGVRKFEKHYKFPSREEIETFAKLKKEYKWADWRSLLSVVSRSQAFRHHRWFLENGLSIRINKYRFRKRFNTFSEWLLKYYVPNELERYELVLPQYLQLHSKDI